MYLCNSHRARVAFIGLYCKYSLSTQLAPTRNCEADSLCLLWQGGTDLVEVLQECGCLLHELGLDLALAGLLGLLALAQLCVDSSQLRVLGRWLAEALCRDKNCLQALRVSMLFTGASSSQRLSCQAYTSVPGHSCSMKPMKNVRWLASDHRAWLDQLPHAPKAFQMQWNG